ncbi:hypothetical protein HMPREF1544_10585 [Mucor circinelloides 1006PhL]|uniref:DUF202 domain-containing protein n=1 Tax=Mucor circinelloides f. circinelloides (strain 1006PhL) TaxID=1220926 RepID=S2J3G5_MUCC1|nr:hypothetical protein HMPREF1544_10585 [Mucor circinelloides 1006PhL]
MSESRPLLSTVQTRQVYLACPETLDPLYHKPTESNIRHRCPSFSQSIRSVGSDDVEYIPPQHRNSHDSITETLHNFMDDIQEEEEKDDDVVNANARSKRQPTDSIAYVQRLEDFFDRFSSSLYLENAVAVARDHMANERTYLAWVRTSLSIISIGVAITQLFRLDKDMLKDPAMADDMVAIGKPLGMTFIVIGLFYMIFAFIRYFHSQVAMTKGYFPASRGIVIVASTATFTALLTVFIVILQKN